MLRCVAPCPVVGVVVRGSVLFQLDGDPPRPKTSSSGSSSCIASPIVSCFSTTPGPADAVTLLPVDGWAMPAGHAMRAAAGSVALRVAAVLAFAQSRPELAAAFWPTHPSVQLTVGLQTIGSSVAAGHAPSPAVTAQLRAVASRDPLNPGPLLVEGTNAFAAGDLARAEPLLLAASRLDPLAPAPRHAMPQQTSAAPLRRDAATAPRPSRR